MKKLMHLFFVGVLVAVLLALSGTGAPSSATLIGPSPLAEIDPNPIVYGNNNIYNGTFGVTSAYTGYVDLGGSTGNYFMTASVYDYATIGAVGDLLWVQTSGTDPVEMSFDYRDLNGYTKVTYGLAGALTSFDVYGGDQSWHHIDAILYPGAVSAEFRCTIHVYTTGGSGASVFDVENLSVSEVAPVPEPATMLLLCFGLVGLAGVRRKIKT